MSSIGYITGAGQFPKQLTPEQENECYNRYKNGDNNGRNELIEHNLRLVAHIAKKYQNKNNCEDLISIGTIGLIKAIESFDPDKGSRLGTYAVRCIENEILMYIRSTKKLANEVSLNEPVGVDKEGNEVTIIDLLSLDDESMLEELDRSMAAGKLKEIMDKVLSQRERLILQLRYGLMNQEEKTQKEVGKILSLSRSYISRIEKGALEKLRIALS